jgi:hypothetical protein
MLLDPGHNLRIREFVGRLDVDGASGMHLGAPETPLELTLRLTGAQDQQPLGSRQLFDDGIEIPVQILAVAAVAVAFSMPDAAFIARTRPSSR